MAAKGLRRERKLPVRQLVVLAICRFAEPISGTSLLPYVPAMIRSFDIPEQDVGKWAGMCAATFSLSQAIMGVPWGRFSDRYGRKLPILLGLISTMITTLLWGFSRSLPMAIAARAAAGAGNGNVGIIRTTVAEMVPFKELQPLAFSLMPLVFNIGSILGPAIGGALANPLNVQPGESFEHPSFLQRFPYALPNLVSACFFLIGITVGWLFLEETLAPLRGRRDWGLRCGDVVTRFTRSIGRTARSCFRRQPSDLEGATEPLLKGNIVPEQQSSPEAGNVRVKAPSFREVLNKQAVLNLVVYTLLAMHSMAFESLLPVYLQYPSLSSGDEAVTKPGVNDNPLRFAGGASLDHFTIGLMSTGNGVYGMFLQFLVYPRVARRFGVLYCLKWCACVFPLAGFMMPWTALISSRSSQIATCWAIMLFKCTCGIFAFPCSTILLTNSASSSRTLGTLNGLATSMSAIGRAAGPAIGGAVFSIGVKKGFVIAPWWVVTAVATIAAIPVFWLVEGEGFGGDEEVIEEEVVIEDEGTSIDPMPDHGIPVLEAAEAAETLAQLNDESDDMDDNESIRRHRAEERAYGEPRTLLSRTTTASSAMTVDDIAVSSRSTTRPGSLSQSRRSSMRIVRPITSPIGTGQGVSRRYSSNLGHSLGSSGGFAE